jgi:hypothetical protein
MKITLPYFPNIEARKSNSNLVDPVEYEIAIIEMYVNEPIQGNYKMLNDTTMVKKHSELMQCIIRLEKELDVVV